jgi:hypothetical protein
VKSWISAAALLAVVGATGIGNAARSASAPVQVTANELRLREPLAVLAADGPRAAFAFCDGLVGTWRPGAANVTRLGPVSQWTCPTPRGPERAFGIALAGNRVAWVASAGGNIYTNLVFLGVLSHPHTLTLAWHGKISAKAEGFFLDKYPTPSGDKYMLGTQFEP